jgi:hypothetical protein
MTCCTFIIFILGFAAGVLSIGWKQKWQWPEDKDDEEQK